MTSAITTQPQLFSQIRRKISLVTNLDIKCTKKQLRDIKKVLSIPSKISILKTNVTTNLLIFVDKKGTISNTKTIKSKYLEDQLQFFSTA